MFLVRLNTELPGLRFIRFEGKPTDAELQAYFQSELTRLGTETQHDEVTVLCLAQVWTSTQRQRMREFEQEAEKLTTAKRLGIAMVVPNSLIRGAFTAYLWLTKPAYPTTMVATAADAYAFAAEKLRQIGHPVPDQAEFTRVANATWTARIFDAPSKDNRPFSEAS